MKNNKPSQIHFGSPADRHVTHWGDLTVVAASLILLYTNLSFLMAEQPASSASEEALGVYALVLYVWLAWLILTPLVLSMLVWTLLRRSRLQAVSYRLRIAATVLSLLSILLLFI